MGEKSANSPRPVAEELQKADGAGDELGLCNHRARKPEAETGGMGHLLRARVSEAAHDSRVCVKTQQSALYFT